MAECDQRDSRRTDGGPSTVACRAPIACGGYQCPPPGLGNAGRLPRSRRDVRDLRPSASQGSALGTPRATLESAVEAGASASTRWMAPPSLSSGSIVCARPVRSVGHPPRPARRGLYLCVFDGHADDLLPVPGSPVLAQASSWQHCGQGFVHVERCAGPCNRSCHPDRTSNVPGRTRKTDLSRIFPVCRPV